jgi:hypothetical protein
MRRFFMADVNATGELRALAEYRYEQLEQIPGAGDLIGTLSGAVWRSPQEFEVRLHDERPHLVLRWRASAATAGVATVWDGKVLASVSLACSGLDEDADRITLDAYQRHLLHELRDTGYEPAFSLVHLRERPLLASVSFAAPDDPTDKILVALADRCFGAAFFRYLSLA